jgi:hypothetical protein
MLEFFSANTRAVNARRAVQESLENETYRNNLVYQSSQGWQDSVCTDKATAYDALNEVFTSGETGWSECYSYPNYYFNSALGQWIYDSPAIEMCNHRNNIYWFNRSLLWRGVEVRNDGYYLPDFSSFVALDASGRSFAGIKDDDMELYEDPIHFVSGSASLDATLNLTVNNQLQVATVRFDAKRDALAAMVL